METWTRSAARRLSSAGPQSSPWRSGGGGSSTSSVRTAALRRAGCSAAGSAAVAAGDSIDGVCACAEGDARMTLPTPRTLVTAGLTLVAVALAAFGGWAWWDAQHRRALVDTAEVLARVQPALAPDATAEVKLTGARELEQLLERFPSARTVPSVAYELGNLRFSAGQYAAARAAYDVA